MYSFPRYYVDGEEFLINPDTFFMDHSGAPVEPWHLNDVQEHADAILYYGAFGLLDPKMPFEAFAYRKALNVTLLAGAGISMSSGVAVAAAVGWAFDPADKHGLGIMQSDAWDRFVIGDWFGL